MKRVTVLLFKITGGFLNAATSTLKRVSVRIFKISKCFHRSKQIINFYFLYNKALKNLETISAYTESTDFTSRTFKILLSS